MHLGSSPVSTDQEWTRGTLKTGPIGSLLPHNPPPIIVPILSGLVDLSQSHDQFLMETLELELALSLLRHIRDENFLVHFQKIPSLLLKLRSRKTGLEYIETILRYIYYARNKAEWSEFIEIMHHSERIIEEVAMATIAEHLMEKGMVSEAHHVLLEDLEDQFGSIPAILTEELQMIEDLTILRSLRRQRKDCQSLDAFKDLIERSLQ